MTFRAWPTARLSLVVLGMLLSPLLAEEQPSDRPLERFEFTRIQMGMPFRIVLYAPDEDSANAAADAAYARIAQLNGILSDYDPRSELMQLCGTAGTGTAVAVSADLMTVLSRAGEVSRASEGAFDVSVGPAVRLWRTARKTGIFPTMAQVAAARQLVDYRQIRLNPEARAVTLCLPGMQLDLGGIAAGYAVDQALGLLKQRGVRSALIDASGDIGVSDAPPGKSGWRIGIAPLEPDAEPSRYITLCNAAVTTSGDAYQFVEFEGKRYSHIVDPKSALGLTISSSVSVIARDCTTADSYATAVSVLGPERGLKLIETTCDAAAVIVRVANGKPEQFESRRLRNYLVPRETGR
jgi:FAD:protein FMN transferase